jgi:hypothetical protein
LFFTCCAHWYSSLGVCGSFQLFQSFNRCAPFKPPLYILPRDAGEETGGDGTFGTTGTIRTFI